MAAVKRPPRVPEAGWAHIIQVSAHIAGPLPGFPDATATATATAALLSGLAPVELSLHRDRTKSAPSPGSLSRCFLPPLVGPASLSFKEPPHHKRKVKLPCSSLPFPDGRLLSVSFPKRMLGPGFQQRMVLSLICGAPFPSFDCEVRD